MSDASDTDVPEGLADLPPSAKYVWKTLATTEPATQSTLREETDLPRSTVRYALRRLDEKDALRIGYAPDDARVKTYERACAGGS